MIITARKRISFLWVVLATLPWMAVIFKDKVMGIAFTFSMRKFVENPAALTFLLTLPWYISWIVPPVVNFLGDRIWTRFGRRKPFIIVSWIGTITSIGLMPLAPGFGSLLTCYMIFCIFNDLGSPVESLKMEIVPPAQRAVSAAVMSWIGQVAVLVFWVVAIGRFDEATTMFGLSISGEQGLFWTVSIGMVVMLLFLMLGIKETNPHSALAHEKFSLHNVLSGLFSRHLWPVYILAFSVAVLGTGLGAFNQLLITEQWGYSKQEQGTNIAVGGIINLMLIPILGLLSKRVGRGTVYVGLVIAGIVVNLAMYLYYNLVLYDARPTLIEMIVFGEMLSVIGILTGMALTPFVYDFIPRNELGTYAAGSGLVGRMTGIITTNLMGLFVWGYAVLFLFPPGDAVRVAFRDDQKQTDVQAVIRQTQWIDPRTGIAMASPHINSHAWYATGAKLDHGRGFEIRLKDSESALIREQRDRLETARGEYRARKGYAINRLRAMGVDVPAPAGQPSNPGNQPSSQPAAASPPALGPAAMPPAALLPSPASPSPASPSGIAPSVPMVPASNAPAPSTAPTVILTTAPTTTPTTAPAAMHDTPLFANWPSTTQPSVKAPTPPDFPVIRDAAVFADDLLKRADSLAAAGHQSSNSDPRSRSQATAAAEGNAEALLDTGIKQLDTILDWRAQAFGAEVQAAFDRRLLRDGDQILDAAVEPVAVATFPLTARPDPDAVEQTLDTLHRSDPTTIDLCVVPAGNGFTLEMSAGVEMSDPANAAAHMQSTLSRIATGDLRRSMNWPPAMPQVRAAQAIRLDLRIIEDPLDRHPSPITRLVNRVAGLVIQPATPERRINALGRNMRKPGVIDHVGVSTPPGDDNAVRIEAIFSSTPDLDSLKLDQPSAAVVRRLKDLLKTTDVVQAVSLYSMIVPAAKEQRMTIAQPILSTSFAKQQYDYLTGYVAVLILQVAGLCITFYFLYLVRKGSVRRRGAEEAEAVR